MNDLHEGEVIAREMTTEPGMVAALNRSEIDQQITTAKKYPRSVSGFIKRATELVTLNESIAQQCIYALPRDGKTIEGPSARMAEVIFNAWGNSRAGARIVNDSGDFITAQGVFHDLEQNTAITYEVQRRIVGKNGKRFNADMIGVTGNAASSIALRNAILKGIPKAYWESIYKKARATVAGDIQTLANKRANAIKEFAIFGVTEAHILARLGKAGVADISGDDLVTLFGMLTAIKEGDTTPEDAFAVESSAPPAGPPSMTAEAFAASLPGWTTLIQSGKKTADQIITMAESKAKLSDEQKAELRAIEAPVQTEAAKPDAAKGAPLKADAKKLEKRLREATDLDLLDADADLIKTIDDQSVRDLLDGLYKTTRAKLVEGGAA